MEAGRELNLLIATKIMDWIHDKETDAFHDGYIGIGTDDFKPSERIEDALLVVDKLDMSFTLDRSKVFVMNQSKVESYHKTEYRATFWIGSTGFTIEEDSAPLAICLAALQTL